MIYGCFGHTPTVSAQDKDRQALFQHAKNSTTTLLIADEKQVWRPFCTAVWISSTKMLTARHCVEDDDNPTANLTGTLVPFRTPDQTAKKYQKGEKPYYAIVLAVDTKTDLALLSSVDVPKHEFLRIANYKTWVGQYIYIIGHPIGWEYTITQGMISGHRDMEVFGTKWPTVQIAGVVGPGNSGGPAFDAWGNIVGICSFTNGRVPGVAMFMPAKAIWTFLKREDSGVEL